MGQFPLLRGSALSPLIRIPVSTALSLSMRGSLSFDCWYAPIADENEAMALRCLYPAYQPVHIEAGRIVDIGLRLLAHLLQIVLRHLPGNVR